MSQELIYTSAEKGLRLGSRGFCTVASSSGMAKPLADRLEALSGYRHLFAPGTEKAHLNPPNYSFVLTKLSGATCYVLSRIADAGLDHTQRSNKLAHHVVLSGSELTPAGPAWLLSQPGYMTTQWNSQPKLLPPNRAVPQGELNPQVCRNWKSLAGDAGWAGVLAETATTAKDAYVIFAPGTEVLPLVLEAQALLTPAQRWGATFSTYFMKLPPGVECRWRFVAEGTPEAQIARRSPGMVVIDLASSLAAPKASPWVEAARTGKRISESPKAAETAQVPPPPPTVEPVEAVFAGDVEIEPQNAVAKAPPKLPSKFQISELSGSYADRKSGGRVVLWAFSAAVLLVSVGLGITFFVFRESADAVVQIEEVSETQEVVEKDGEALGDTSDGSADHTATTAETGETGSETDWTEERRSEPSPSESEDMQLKQGGATDQPQEEQSQPIEDDWAYHRTVHIREWPFAKGSALTGDSAEGPKVFDLETSPPDGYFRFVGLKPDTDDEESSGTSMRLSSAISLELAQTKSNCWHIKSGKRIIGELNNKIESDESRLELRLFETCPKPQWDEIRDSCLIVSSDSNQEKIAIICFAPTIKPDKPEPYLLDISSVSRRSFPFTSRGTSPPLEIPPHQAIESVVTLTTQYPLAPFVEPVAVTLNLDGSGEDASGPIRFGPNLDITFEAELKRDSDGRCYLLFNLSARSRSSERRTVEDYLKIAVEGRKRHIKRYFEGLSDKDLNAHKDILPEIPERLDKHNVAKLIDALATAKLDELNEALLERKPASDSKTGPYQLPKDPFPNSLVELEEALQSLSIHLEIYKVIMIEGESDPIKVEVYTTKSSK